MPTGPINCVQHRICKLHSSSSVLDNARSYSKWDQSCGDTTECSSIPFQESAPQVYIPTFPNSMPSLALLWTRMSQPPLTKPGLSRVSLIFAYVSIESLTWLLKIPRFTAAERRSSQTVSVSLSCIRKRSRVVGYSNNVIGIVVTLLGIKFGTANVDKDNFSTILRSLTFVGTILGQLSFGRSYLISSPSSYNSTLSQCHVSPPHSPKPSN